MTLALLCALIASLAVVVAPAAAEEVDTAETAEFTGALSFAEITGPESPERYPFQVRLGSEKELRQISETEAAVFYIDGPQAYAIYAMGAHDADDANVPTTLAVTGEEVVTLTVDHRAGNPAAGGEPFVYPILSGSGREPGAEFFYGRVEVGGPLTLPEESPAPVQCDVPKLHDLKLAAAKAKLRAAHCAIGKVRIASGATATKGRVAKQFSAAGTELAVGARVAVKLGSR